MASGLSFQDLVHGGCGMLIRAFRVPETGPRGKTGGKNLASLRIRSLVKP